MRLGGGAGVDHRDLVFADEVGIGAAKGHGRRVRGQNATQPFGQFFGLTGNGMELGLWIGGHVRDSIRAWREMQCLSRVDIPFSTSVQ